MLRDIIIVQHCQSEHHTNDLTGGWTDTSLTEIGERQAVLLSRRLKNLSGINDYFLISSDLLIAGETAEIIISQINLQFTLDKRLREINNGDAAWKTKEWAKANRNAELTKNFNLNHREYKNGETWKEFFLRISACMDDLEQSGMEKIIAVTHGCDLGYITAWWMFFNFEFLEKCYFSASPASVTILMKNQLNQHALKVFNCTRHLSEYS